MAVAPKKIPARKTPPFDGSLLSPVNLSDLHLKQTLMLLSGNIVQIKPPEILQKRNISKIINKVRILSSLFQFLGDSTSPFPQSALVCLNEMVILLQRIKSLLENCSKGSKILLLLHHESVSNDFHQMTLEMATLLDIFLQKKLDINQDLKEQMDLLTKQCQNSTIFTDPAEEKLKNEILSVIEEIERKIVPDPVKIENLFRKLEIRDWKSCNEEIKTLEEEIQDQSLIGKSTERITSLISLLRYCNCVLYGAFAPESHEQAKIPATDISPPVDFQCPISLELMSDPVVVATGHTYERANISRWIEKGHATCPKTGQPLPNTNLTPNLALQSLIGKWCREQNIPWKKTESNRAIKAVSRNKAALEAAKMTALFLIEKLAGSPPTDIRYRLMYELRVLAKSGSDTQAYMAEAGAIPVLLGYFDSEDPNLQVNAVTAILNLSLLEENKSRVMEANGGLRALIHVLESGRTWEARENAAAAICSLSSVHAYKKLVGEEPGAISGLVRLLRNGTARARRDALATLLSLAFHHDNVNRIRESGAVGLAVEMLSGEGGDGDTRRREWLVEAAVTLVAIVVKRCGGVVAAEAGVVEAMVGVLRSGTAKTKEHALAVLVAACGFRGSRVAAVLTAPLIKGLIRESMTSGTLRGRRKATELRRICRIWAAVQLKKDEFYSVLIQ